MTRLLLWEEYKEQHPDGYGYTQFKEYYNRYKQTLNPSMHQIHYAGDKLFVDFSGLTVAITDPVMSIVYQGETIALHTRLHHPNQDSTLKEHMPLEHQYQYEKWNPGHILNWAQSIGEQTTLLMQEIMQHRSHPVCGYRSCMAILGFAKHYGDEALELTSQKARKLNIRSVSSIESILKRKTYLEQGEHTAVNNSLFNQHENIRGSDSYQ